MFLFSSYVKQCLTDVYKRQEMESSAIQLYTRALSLMEQLGRQDEPLYGHLALMRADEQEHLAQFRALGGKDGLTDERRVAPVSYTHLDVYKRQVQHQKP